MSDIKEQVRKLRGLAEGYARCQLWNVADNFKQAADTIEALSAKLQAANMERSTAYYNGGWIPCKERLPNEEKYYLVTFKNWGKKYVIEYCLFENEKWYMVADGKKSENMAWKEEIGRVIAWKPLPEPYKPQ